MLEAAVCVATQVCERLSEVGYPNYVPAKVSDSESERGDVNTLARFHFTCYPKNWYYWTRKVGFLTTVDMLGAPLHHSISPCMMQQMPVCIPCCL